MWLTSIYEQKTVDLPNM